ncbi:MAG TPA: PspC domain-containing protein [Woeseiaceae bacterium]|nr:PspC domain-containing protein [Woeseiaceae bacterium]
MSAGVAGRFYRDADRAILGGVCAGLARYLGFNLKATRILAFIAFLMFMPFVVVAYLVVVVLVPAESSGETIVRTRRRRSRICGRRRKKEVIEDDTMGESPAKSSLAEEIDQRCRSMDERLRILEKHVTSKRFQLEQELSRL